MGLRRILLLVALALVVVVALTLIVATWEQGPPTRSGAAANTVAGTAGQPDRVRPSGRVVDFRA